MQMKLEKLKSILGESATGIASAVLGWGPQNLYACRGAEGSGNPAGDLARLVHVRFNRTKSGNCWMTQNHW
jgi:hypothetical protein